MTHEVLTLDRKPRLADAVRRLDAASWPEFLHSRGLQGLQDGTTPTTLVAVSAMVIAVAPATVTVTGTVAEWERWTGMRFPESGEYVVEGALQPVRIDRAKDEGRYEDPCYWMRHPVRSGP